MRVLQVFDQGVGPAGVFRHGLGDQAQGAYRFLHCTSSDRSLQA